MVEGLVLVEVVETVTWPSVLAKSAKQVQLTVYDSIYRQSIFLKFYAFEDRDFTRLHLFFYRHLPN